MPLQIDSAIGGPASAPDAPLWLGQLGSCLAFKDRAKDETWTCLWAQLSSPFLNILPHWQVQL